MTDYNKLSKYVGFAVRAGQVLWGSDLIMEKKRKRKLILLSSTASENLRDKIAAYAEETGSKLIILEDGYTLEDILKRNTKALAITNKDLADAIIRSVEIKEKENG